jgi:hypothetical protein
MVQDVAREPYFFGGHEYKLLSNLGDETGEEREVRIDREQLATNGPRLTLGMVRTLAEESPGQTDGDSGDEKVGLLVDSKVGQCVEERSPLSNSPSVKGGKPSPHKVRPRVAARPAREKPKIRPIEIAREARARRQRQAQLIVASQPPATFGIENPPDPPEIVEEITPTASKSKSSKAFVSSGLGNNQSAM